MRRLSIMADANGSRAAPRPSEYVDAHVLAANVAESFTIPAGARFVRLTGEGSFYYNPNGAAAVPAADITNGSSSVLVQGSSFQVMLALDAETAISVISKAINTVTAEYWA